MLHHLAIIMDGNRRWAKARFLPAIFGHKAGYDNLKKIVKLSDAKWIKYLTVWWLSTENLIKRDQEEIDGIVRLVNHSIKLLPDLKRDNVQIHFIGDLSKLPQKSRDILNTLTQETENNTGLIFTVALVYGGQDEIVRTTQKIIKAGINPEDLNETEFRKYLDTAYLPPAEVIVRTGGDIRHSGFLLYDSAYSEYYFTDKKWPEFDEEELQKVIEFFKKSQRNFGK
jgi:undecaprenyl diphosphate synthase